jgi:hypothetical protein
LKLLSLAVMKIIIYALTNVSSHNIVALAYISGGNE